jgi:hypothetical protein
MSAIAFGMPLKFNEAYTEGITRHIHFAFGQFFGDIHIAVSHLNDIDPAAGTARNLICIAGQYRIGTAAYSANSQQSYIQLLQAFAPNFIL